MPPNSARRSRRSAPKGRSRRIHDEIEDLRAGAKPLADIAKEKGLTLVQIPAVDAGGLDKAGNPVDLPEKDAVVKAAFASDIGVDNEALRTGTGYVWYDVTGIEPSREKTLDEVRDQVAAPVARGRGRAAPVREGARS